MATVLLGRTSAGTTADFNAASHTAVWKVTAVATGTLATLFGQTKVANATGTVTMGVYADNAGAVGTFLGKATATGATGTGVFSADISASAISIVSSTAYWIGWRNSAENFDFQGDSSGSYQENTGTADFPASFGTGGAGTVNAIIWGEDAAGGGGGTQQRLMLLGAGQ